MVKDTYKGGVICSMGRTTDAHVMNNGGDVTSQKIKAWFDVWGILGEENLPARGCYENTMNSLRGYHVLSLGILSMLNLFLVLAENTDGKDLGYPVM